MTRVAEIAVSWIGTPFLGGQWPAVKGRAADCCSFVAGVLAECRGDDLTAPHYDWQAPWSRGDDLIEPELAKIADPIHESAAREGDIVLFRLGRGWSHAAIYLSGDRVIHCDGHYGVVVASLREGRLRGRARRFWRLTETR